MSKKINILLILILWTIGSYATHSDTLIPEVLYRKDFIHNIDSLREEYGANKTFLPRLELQALIALSHYPKLKETHITFRQHKLKTTMAARPRVWSAIRKKGKRKYVISLDDFDAAVPFDSASFNAQIGIIGHELAHIAYYEKQKAWILMGLPFKYMNKKYRTTFEHDTDKRAIKHGLGWQLFAWKKHSEYFAKKTPNYYTYKKEVYLSSETVLQLTKNYFTHEE